LIAAHLFPDSFRHPRLQARLPIWLLLLSSLSLVASCRKEIQTKPAEPPAQVATKKSSLEVPMPVVGKPYPGKGIVTFISLKEGWIEINHEAIEGLMPAMQMEWSVKDQALLRNVRVGDKVDFVVVETGKGEIITALNPVTPPK
jgi:Cu/Ag efflux protein CusF